MCQFNKPTSQSASSNSDEGRFLLKAGCQSQNGAVITAETLDGVTYYTTTYRGVLYTAYIMKSVGEWFVATKRLSLGRFGGGGGRYYKDLTALTAGCKAFAGLAALLDVAGTAN